MDIKKKMGEKSEQFNSLLVEKAELEGRISLINEELLRLQGEYRVLQELLPPEEVEE
jgi:uncharacterized small protein (DUF1192 family)